MQLSDWIFWWTGAVAWAVIGVAMLVAVVIAILWATFKAHRNAGHWQALWYFARHDIDHEHLIRIHHEAKGRLPLKKIDVPATLDFISELHQLHERHANEDAGKSS